MPMFFVLAGYMSKLPGDGVGAFVRSKARTRLLPAYFFCFLAYAAFALVALVQDSDVSWVMEFEHFLPLLYGTPAFNLLTWFLFCLFSVEMLHLALYRTEGSLLREVAILLAIYSFGSYVAFNHGAITSWIGLSQFPLYGTEALIAYTLFRLGRLLARTQVAVPGRGRGVSLITAAISLIVVLLLFPRNDGPFSWMEPSVVMAMMSHGDFVLFPITAVAGTLFIFHTAYLIPASRALRFIGQNSVALLGLNGILFFLVNQPVAMALSDQMGGSHLRLFVASGAVAAAELLICVPIVMLLNRYLPWALGRSATSAS
jgi:fucose 4-O-acetylase-like acetyltransferase